MLMIDNLLDSLTGGSVLDVRIGAFWTAVTVEIDGTRRCGLAASLRNNNHHHTLRADVETAGHLTGQSARQLAGLIRSGSMLEASVGMAVINALLPAYEERYTEGNAEDVIIQYGAGKNVAVVGHFPFVAHLRERVDTLWVLELHPRDGDLPAHAAPEIIPQADVVAITSTTLINHTLKDLLPLCRPQAHVLLLGPSTPLSPILFDYGVNFLSGVLVENIDKVLQAVGQGANFRQLHRQGIRLVTMENFARPGGRSKKLTSLEISMPTYPKFDLNNYPPPLLTSPEDDYFSYNTIATRKPKIVSQVLADHAGQYPQRIEQALHNLHAELAQGRRIQPLKPTSAPDARNWHAAWLPYQDKTWFEIPWYFAETFFYRRLLEAVEYFGESEWAGIDPFLPRKQVELNHEIPWQVLGMALNYAANNSGDNFCALLRHCIWGNRVDLSHPHMVEEMRRNATHQKALGDLLVDDTEAVLAVLQQATPATTRLDFICDNTGTELLLDLALVDFFLRHNWAKQITLHVKYHPTFVSDTIPVDIDLTLNAMQQHSSSEIPALAGRLQNYRQEQRLVVKEHLFWNSSRFFWELPADIQTDLSQASLVISKGDANYRRLLGDAHWPPDVPFAQAVPFFPAPFVALRTMKSNVITGLPPGRAEALDQEDPDWRVNGRRGVIQGVF